jgi:hypothetical protein
MKGRFHTIVGIIVVVLVVGASIVPAAEAGGRIANEPRGSVSGDVLRIGPNYRPQLLEDPFESQQGSPGSQAGSASQAGSGWTSPGALAGFSLAFAALVAAAAVVARRGLGQPRTASR